jgi:hypothetical protein
VSGKLLLRIALNYVSTSKLDTASGLGGSEMPSDTPALGPDGSGQFGGV